VISGSWRSAAFAPLLLSMATSKAYADPEAVARPAEIEQLRTNTAYVVEEGEVEIDLVPSYFDHVDFDEYGVEAELEFGVSERVMLELEVPYRKVHYRSARDSDGLGNVEVAAKYLFTDQGHFAAAINLGIAVPAGDQRQGIASDLWAVELSVPVSFRFPNVHGSLHLELGTEWEEHEGFEETFANVACEYRTSRGGVAWQLGGNFAYEEDELEAYVIPAFEVAASELPFQFGLGIPVGLGSNAADWGILVDLEVEF
jgi:hypothetical protein